MSKSRLEWKVGLFVVIGLVLVAGLMLEFSKGLSLFRPTYNILLKTESVSGLKQSAGVLEAGVQVGIVSGIRLDTDGRHVTIDLRIDSGYRIHKDAVFSIETSGFLGDQYVAIMPTENKAPVFENGDSAIAQEPFNLQAAARTTLGFINRLDETAKKLDDAIVDIRRLLLNQETLTNMALAVANLHRASDQAALAIDRINALVATNAPALTQTGTNLVVFSEQLTQFGASLRAVLATNAPGVQASVKNIESSTEVLKHLMDDAQAGKGLVGMLLKDEQTSKDVAQVVQNLSVTAKNLSITTSNLNSHGLWGIFWAPKAPHTNAPPGRFAAPKDLGQ